jgi:undecaprenyl-diphosphatase
MLLFAHLNTSLFAFLHTYAGRFSWLDTLFVWCGEYLAYGIIFVVLLPLLFPRWSSRQQRLIVIVALTAALVARFVVKELIVLVIAEPRPFLYLHSTPLIATAPYELMQSFPSGHAIFFFALATVIYLFSKRFGVWFFAAATVMGVARVFASVHWPMDIVIGALLGTVVGLVTYLLYRRYEHTLERVLEGLVLKFGRK